MIFFLFYNFLILPLLYLLFLLQGLVHKKTRNSLVARERALSRLKKNLLLHTTKPRLWCHVSSAGEFVMAAPILKRLKEIRPEIQIVVTTFSSSGYNWIQNSPTASTFVDIFEYYRFDDWLTVKAYFRLMAPDVILLVKNDLWPNLLWWAAKKNCPVLLCSATARTSFLQSKILFLPSIFKFLLSKITLIGVMDKHDELAFLRLGVEKARLFTGGNIKYDAVLERKKHFEAQKSQTTLAPYKELLSQHTSLQVLMVGSSWPDDEDFVLEALKHNKLLEKFYIFFVPHEVTASRVEELQKKAEEVVGLHFTIVTKSGILADLYSLAQFAFVGTGRGGLHNVLEPAVWGCAVAFRENKHPSLEASQLLDHGLAQALKSASELSDFLSHKTPMDKKAVNLIQSSSGATALYVEQIQNMLNVS